MLLPYYQSNISTKHDLMLSEPILEELLNIQGWFVVEMENEHFVAGFNKSEVTFCVKVEAVCC